MMNPNQPNAFPRPPPPNPASNMLSFIPPMQHAMFQSPQYSNSTLATKNAENHSTSNKNTIFTSNSVPMPSAPFINMPIFSDNNMPLMLTKPMPKDGPIFSGHLIKPSNSSFDWVHEIFFEKPYFVEGVHIVPSKISVRNIMLEGKTLPDMFTRPFDLSVFSRPCTNESNKVNHVISVKVTGGVEWLPFPQHKNGAQHDLNSTGVDYLAFLGDFESLSVIIHGHELPTGEEETVRKLPLPPHYNALTTPLSQLRHANMPDGADHIQLEVNAIDETLFFDKLNQPLAEMIDDDFSAFVECNLSGKNLSFSLPDDQIDQTRAMVSQLRSKGLELDLKELGQILSSLTTVLSFAFATESSSNITVELCYLPNVLANLLNLLRTDFAVPMSHALRIEEEDGPFGERVDTLETISKNLLACCIAILGYKDSAFAFYSSGGFSLLTLLIQQQPVLPQHILIDVVKCFAVGSLHFDIALKLIEPSDEGYFDESDESPLSAYQAVLLVVASLRPDSPVVYPCKEFLAFTTFVEAARSLQEACYGVLDKVRTILEAISWRHSSNNNSTFSADEGDDASGRAEDSENKILHAAGESILLINSTIGPCLGDFIRAIRTVLRKTVTISSEEKDDRETHQRTIDPSTLDQAITTALSRTKIVTALLSLVAASKAVEDFAAVADWSAPGGENLVTIADEFKTNIALIIIELSRVENIDLIFANSFSEIEVLRSFAFSSKFHDNGLRGLISIFGDVDTTFFGENSHSMSALSGRGTELFDSIGYNLALSICALSYAQKSFRLLRLQSDTLTKLEVDETSHRIELIEGLCFLSMLLTYDAGRYIVHRVISVYFLPSIINILELPLLQDDEIAQQIFDAAFKLIENTISCSVDPIVLRQLNKNSAELLTVFMNIDDERYTKNADDICKGLALIKDSYENSNSFLHDLVKCIPADVNAFVQDPTCGGSKFLARKFHVLSCFAIAESYEIYVCNSEIILAIINLNNSINLFISYFVDSSTRDALVQSPAKYPAKWLMSFDKTVQEFVEIFHQLTSLQLSYLKMLSSFSFDAKILLVDKSLEDLLLSIEDSYTLIYNLCRESENRSELKKIESTCVEIITKIILQLEDKAATAVKYLFVRAFSTPNSFDPVLELLSNLLPDSDAPVDTFNLWLELFSSATTGHATALFEGQQSERRASEKCDQLLDDILSGAPSIVSIILSSIYSSSENSNKLGINLAHKYISLSAATAAHFCNYFIASLRRNMLQLLLTKNATEVETFGDEEMTHLVSRALIFTEILCAEDNFCFTVCLHGILEPVFYGLRTKKEAIAILSVQCAITAHKTLTRILSQPQYIPSDDLKTFLTHLVENIARAMVSLIPAVLKDFKELSSPTVIEQCVLYLQIIHPRHLNSFLDRLALIGEGLSFEFISVKLWLAFEDSFQLLNEASDICKLISSNDSAGATEKEAVQSLEMAETWKILSEGHASFMCAVGALKAVCELVLLAYMENWIPLSTLAKAMRTSFADPKKVVIRFQRVYTMWATSGLKYPDLNSSDGVANLLGDFHGEVGDFRGCRMFESRHALISTGLRALVDYLTKMSRFMLAKEERYSGEATVTFASDFDVYLDLNKPYESFLKSPNDLLFQWYKARDLRHRLSRSSRAFGIDTLHNDLRRNIMKSEIGGCYNSYHALEFAQTIMLPKCASAIVEISDQEIQTLSLQQQQQQQEQSAEVVPIDSPMGTAGKKRKNRFSASTEDQNYVPSVSGEANPQPPEGVGNLANNNQNMHFSAPNMMPFPHNMPGGNGFPQFLPPMPFSSFPGLQPGIRPQHPLPQGETNFRGKQQPKGNFRNDFRT